MEEECGSGMKGQEGACRAMGDLKTWVLFVGMRRILHREGFVGGHAFLSSPPCPADIIIDKTK